MSITLRPHQRTAVDAISAHFEQHTDNCLIVIPTGGGKSATIAAFIKETLEQWPDTRILCLVHVRELVEQVYETLLRLWPDAPAGVYSAGLGRRDLGKQITCASIQSIYKRAYDLQLIDLVIVDEAHLIPHAGDGMYRKLLTDLATINKYIKMIGFTATPWRMTSGLLTEGENALFGSIAYDVPITELLDAGYLVPPITRTSLTQIDASSVAIRGGEYVARDLALAADRDDITQAAVDEIVQYGADRRSWLAFCSSVEHSFHVRDAIRARGIACETVTGKTPAKERAEIVEAFRGGAIRCLTNVDCLTIGFDAPAVDMLAILRPTRSAGMWLQILGRGLRISPATSKTDCLVLDYTKNSEFFGPIDKIKGKSKRKGEGGTAPHKACPVCEAQCAASALQCQDCGHEFPPHEIKISDKAAAVALLSTQPQAPQWLPVQSVRYRKHVKEGKAPSLRVTYMAGLVAHNEWIALEHSGYPRTMAAHWWRFRSTVPAPLTVDEALPLTADLRVPSQIAVKPDGKWSKIVDYAFD